MGDTIEKSDQKPIDQNSIGGADPYEKKEQDPSVEKLLDEVTQLRQTIESLKKQVESLTELVSQEKKLKEEAIQEANSLKDRLKSKLEAEIRQHSNIDTKGWSLDKLEAGVEVLKNALPAKITPIEKIPEGIDYGKNRNENKSMLEVLWT